MTNVLLVNDVEQGSERQRLIESALNEAFQGTDCVFHVGELAQPVSLRNATPLTIASRIVSMSPVPDVVLVDGMMPDDPTDGLLVIDALRRADFKGFSYLWSGADPVAEVKSQPGMFA